MFLVTPGASPMHISNAKKRSPQSAVRFEVISLVALHRRMESVPRLLHGEGQGAGGNHNGGGSKAGLGKVAGLGDFFLALVDILVGQFFDLFALFGQFFLFGAFGENGGHGKGKQQCQHRQQRQRSLEQFGHGATSRSCLAGASIALPDLFQLYTSFFWQSRRPPGAKSRL